MLPCSLPNLHHDSQPSLPTSHSIKSLDWGVIDFTLYNETFTSRARAIPRCRFCSSDMHPSHDCVHAPTAMAHGRPSSLSPGHSTQEPCILFNHRYGNRCSFSPCCYLHVCAECRSPRHPASQCPRVSGFPPNKRRRDDPPYSRRLEGEKRP